MRTCHLSSFLDCQHLGWVLMSSCTCSLHSNSAAVCLRLLWALPPLMRPSTWVSGLAYFAGGCAFTVAALFICLVWGEFCNSSSTH